MQQKDSSINHDHQLTLFREPKKCLKRKIEQSLACMFLAYCLISAMDSIRHSVKKFGFVSSLLVSFAGIILSFLRQKMRVVFPAYT